MRKTRRSVGFSGKFMKQSFLCSVERDVSYIVNCSIKFVKSYGLSNSAVQSVSKVTDTKTLTIVSVVCAYYNPHILQKQHMLHNWRDLWQQNI